MLLNSFTTRSSFLSIPARLGLVLVLTMAAMGMLFVILSLAAPGNPVLDPPRNSHTAPLTTTVSITYDEPMDPTTVTSHTFAVHGMQSGLVTETHGVVNGGYTIIVTPTHPFFPGELVYAIATTRTTNITGTHPLTATQWQFNAGEITNRCVAGFSRETAATPTNVSSGDVAWGDYDNDGDLDILLTGYNDSADANVTEVWRNDGGGSFSQASTAPTGVESGSVAWGDYDNDGDLDVLLSGTAGDMMPAPVTEVWRNDGEGSFTAAITDTLTGVTQGSVAWGDYDNDGDLDILLSGTSDAMEPVTEVWRNDGGGSFSQASTAPTNVEGSVAWGDYDNDGDLDILLAGVVNDPMNPMAPPVTEVWRNDGGGSFIAAITGTLTGVGSSSAAWGDYDNDGDLDVLLSGTNNNGDSVTEVWRNDGGGSFSQASTAPTGIWMGSVAWGDYDNDGDLDILLSGTSDAMEPVTEVWRNDGGGSFSQASTAPTNVGGSVAWGDYDNDGDLDILLSGQNSDGNPVTEVWRNEDCPPPDLSIVKTVAPSTAAPGSTITYALSFTNAGSLTATGVVITDSVPVSVTSPTVAGSSGAAITLTGSAPNFVWDVANLAQGEGGVITLTGVLSEPLAAGTFTNTAEIACAETEGDETNNSSDAALTVQNVAPVAGAGADQDVDPGDTVTLDGSGSSDANGDALIYGWTQTGGASVTLSDSSAESPTFTAPITANTALTFTLTVTDVHGLPDATPDEVAVTVDNVAPEAGAGSDQNVDPGDTVTLDGSGSSDANGDALTYGWTQTGGASVTLSDSSAESPTFTAPTSAGALTFTLTVTDVHGLADATPDEVAVTVQNVAPEANAGSDQNVDPGDTVTLDGSASSDANGDVLTYGWTQTGGESVALSDSSAESPTFTAPITANATLTFTLTVTDVHGLPDATPDEVAVTVQNVAPEADARSDQNVDPGDSVTLDGSGSSDANGDALTYGWTQTGGASVALSDSSAESPTFTAPITANTTLTFTLTVTDVHGLADATPDEVVVTVQNVAPEAGAGSDQNVDPGDTATLNGSGSSDANGDALTYGWTQTGGASVALSDSSAEAPTFTAPTSAGALTFTLTVTDVHGLPDATPDEVVITVQNIAPEAGARSDQNVDPGDTVTLDGSGSSDANGDALTYGWTQTGGASVALSDSSAESPTFTAPTSAGALTFTLTVTDVHGLPDATPDEVVITVQNIAPEAGARSDQNVDPGDTVTLDGSGSSDANGDALTYGWTQTGGASVALSDSSAESPTFTAPTSAGALTFTLTVTDVHGLPDATPDEVVITVQNIAPEAGAGSDQNVDPGDTVTLDGSGSSDANGDALTYGWTQTGGASVALSDSSAESPTFTAPTSAGALTFTLTVTDVHGLADATPDEVVVTVGNQPPVADAGADQSVDTDAVVTLDGSSSSDPDGHTPLTYSWTQTGGASVILSSATVSQPTFTAPGDPAVLTFTLAVTDALGLADATPDEVVVTVVEYYVYLPLVFKSYVVAPDLVVQSITATSDSVQVVVVNQGNASVTDEFWVDVYINPDPAPTAVNQIWSDLADEGLVWGVTAGALPLAPGEAITLTVGGDYYVGEYSEVSWPLSEGTPVYVQVDSVNTETTYGAVLESHEIAGGAYNNISSMVSTAGVAGAALPLAGGELRPVLLGNLPTRP